MENFLLGGESQFQASGQKLALIFFKVLLDRSSRSLTHFQTYFKRYYNTLKLLLQQYQTSSTTFLDTIFKVWQNSDFHLKLYLDQITSLRIIPCQIVIEWVFDQLDIEQDRKVFWEICFLIIRKVVTRTDFIYQNIKNSKADEEPKNLENLQKALTSFQKEQKSIFLQVFTRISKQK